MENIYSPINIAFNKFRLNCESLPEGRIPSVYNNEFKDLNDVIMDIASKYGHLFNQETINYYDHEVLKAWLQYSRNPTDIASYKLLNSRIIMFNDFNGRQLNLEKKLLHDLQQLGENMNFDERQIGYDEIKKTFSNALKEADISFLDKFKDKSNLRYIKKLAEIEISKGNSDIGTQLTLILAGASIFLSIYLSTKILVQKDFWNYYWMGVGIMIFIIGAGWKFLTRQEWLQTKKQKKEQKFLYDIILQVERRIP